MISIEKDMLSNFDYEDFAINIAGKIIFQKGIYHTYLICVIVGHKILICLGHLIFQGKQYHTMLGTPKVFPKTFTK